MRFRFSKEKYWSKTALGDLALRVNTMPNEELCSYFKVSLNHLNNTMQKHNIKRDEEVLSQMRTKGKIGEDNPNWKQGISKDTARYQRLQRERHPEHKHARDAVYRALKEGSLVKPDVCSECGEQKKVIEGHHESYKQDHWLDVQWLCKVCHRKKHPDH